MAGALHHTSDPTCLLCEKKLALAHSEIIAWYRDVAKVAYPDMHVSWSFRDEPTQEAMFKMGKTKAHFPQSGHNKTPSLALDLFQIDAAGNPHWDESVFSALHTISAEKYPHVIWGGLWKSIGDADHFEFVPTEPVTKE